MTDPIEIPAWACATCKTPHHNTVDGARGRDKAVACCAPIVCACGASIEKHPYSRRTQCEKCERTAFNAREDAKEQERFEKAEKLAEKPEGEMLYYGDKYYPGWDEIIECCDTAEEVPEWVWATEACSWKGLDVSDILESDRNNYDVEDRDLICEVTDLDWLEAFLEIWNAKQTVTWFELDSTRAIMRPENYLEHFPAEEAPAPEEAA